MNMMIQNKLSSLESSLSEAQKKELEADNDEVVEDVGDELSEEVIEDSDDDERRATWESVIIFGRRRPKNWECLLNEPVDWAARFGGRLGGRYAGRFDAIGRQFCQSGAIEGN